MCPAPTKQGFAFDVQIMVVHRPTDHPVLVWILTNTEGGHSVDSLWGLFFFFGIYELCSDLAFVKDISRIHCMPSLFNIGRFGYMSLLTRCRLWHTNQMKEIITESLWRKWKNMIDLTSKCAWAASKTLVSENTLSIIPQILVNIY